MGPEQTRLLDLLVARCYLINAEQMLQAALVVADIERDGRSHLFERYLDRAVQLERCAVLIVSGRMKPFGSGGWEWLR